MKQTKYKIPPDQYRKLLRKLDLVDIRMIRSDCNLNYKEDELQPVEIKDRILIKQIEKSKVEITHSYKLIAKYKKSEETFINIAASYRLLSIINFEFNKDFFDIYKIFH